MALPGGGGGALAKGGGAQDLAFHEFGKRLVELGLGNIGVGGGLWEERLGRRPAALLAVPSLLALVAVVRRVATIDEVRRSQLAWFGGVALWFITKIFPIQFDRQWLTVSWALEGALLLWLFRRVPHPGLQLTGLWLLATVFARLTLNPWVFTDYPRGTTVLLNWHLSTYGLVAMAQLLGAWWFTGPVGSLRGFLVRGVLFGFGGVLLFLLMNIEIADFFTPPCARGVAFSFGINFARGVTYSIGWSAATCRRFGGRTLVSVGRGLFG
jgi:hypothetical protein